MGLPLVVVIAWIMRKNLLENGPDHCVAPPFLQPHPGAPDHRAVDERAHVIVDAQSLEDALPYTPPCPQSEAVIRRFPSAVSLRDVTPRCSSLESPHHCVDDERC